MMLFLLIPIYGAVSAFFIVMITGYFLTKSEKGKQIVNELANSILCDADISQILSSKLDTDLLDDEVEAVVDKKLDDLVLIFKQQIPMASAFLSGSLVGKLKSSAKVELLKDVPELKKRFIERMKNELDDGTVVEELKDKLTWLCCRSFLMKVGGVACMIGALLGLLQVAWMYLFGYIVV
jgi:hypothetical protein